MTTAPQSNDLQPIFSVTEFIEYINLAIGRKKVVVEGEVSSFHVNQGKWVFFDLKDEESKVSCFMLLYSLSVAIEDGMKVRVMGIPRVHGKSGKFSIFAERVELHGEGALRKAFELTKKKLEKEGLFAPERKRPLPEFPEKIGIIASKESAAYTDFMRILNQRWSGVTVSLVHVQVQGERAVSDIASAFDWFNGNAGFADVLVLIRGGGSLEDLQAFNSESVARAVFGSKIPVVCGVGHEKDETLSDYAADMRAATPTHAATIVVPDHKEVLENIFSHCRTLQGSLENWFEWYGNRIQQSMGLLVLVFQKMEFAVKHLMRRLHTSCATSEARIERMMNMTLQIRSSLAAIQEHGMSMACSNLSHIIRSLENMNPLTVLSRGYSITRNASGAILKKAKDAKTGDHVDIRLSEGSVHAVVAPKQASLL